METAKDFTFRMGFLTGHVEFRKISSGRQQILVSISQNDDVIRLSSPSHLSDIRTIIDEMTACIDKNRYTEEELRNEDGKN
jgi:hypothetical protein